MTRATLWRLPVSPSYIKRTARHLAGEIHPWYWPLALKVSAQDGLRTMVHLPVTPHDYASIGVPTHHALGNVMEWIANAQDASADGGIPAYFSLYGGYGPSYPETTGYLIPTMINYATAYGQTRYIDRAIRATEYLCGLQLTSGAFPGGYARPTDGPSVFNTGQIIFGLVAAWQHTQNKRYLDAAINAANWLAAIQSEDGAWRQHTYEGHSHVYYTMVAWAVAEVFRATADPTFRQVAERNIRSALALQQKNGWFDGYNLNGRPVFLHFIAYTLQGLLEAALLVDMPSVIDSVRRPAERLMRKFEIQKRLAGAFTSDWKPDGRYTCLTGNAQTAIVWERLAEVTGDLRFLNAALKMNELLKASISYRGSRGIRGGIKGSNPVWGRYLAFRYPNWAAKFTADSFMLEQKQLAQLDGDRLRPIS